MIERTCRFVTLGCKANQYDTQIVREALRQAGYREAGPDELADLCVVNTCTVTDHADGEGRYEIRKLVRRNPGTQVVVMGCYAARAASELRALPGVASVIEDRTRLLDGLRPFGVERLPGGVSRFAGHHRAFVKVQDGCMLNCTFCIIPQVRPTLQSRMPDEIEAEVARLVAAGYREIVLTGIHLGHYGIEFSAGRPRREWCRLAQLVRRLVQVPGDWRLRLSSLDAAEVTDELIAVMAGESRVCPHVHVCLQSGSDRVLAAMKRRYRVAGFLRRVEQIRNRLDGPAVTTDVIVGFPGETEQDFQHTLQVAERAGFSKIHIFPFSPRRGTVAAEMSEQVSRNELADRKSRLQVLESQLAERYHRSLVGRSLRVLVEQTGVAESRGTACRYVPVRFSAQPGDEYQLVDVDIVGVASSHLIGQRTQSTRAMDHSLTVIEI